MYRKCKVKIQTKRRKKYGKSKEKLIIETVTGKQAVGQTPTKNISLVTKRSNGARKGDNEVLIKGKLEPLDPLQYIMFIEQSQWDDSG
jgi:hypothetical protein